MEKFYLGLSLGFNSSAALVSNVRGLIAAISQERLNGQKNTKELPIDAALECLKICEVNRIEKVTISHYEEIRQDYFKKYTPVKYSHYFENKNWNNAIMMILDENDIMCQHRDIVRISHHEAHAFSAYAFYGFPKTNDYTITSDGFGDGFSGTILHNDNVLSAVKLKNSIALVYQFVTGALGFKEHQHEGKITGLAAFGKPIYLKTFYNLYRSVEDGNFLDFKDDEWTVEEVVNSPIIDFDKFLKLKKAVYELVYTLQDNYNAKREDIAASVQEFAEETTIKWIKAYCENKKSNCYLAGGLFANVKINQRVKETGLFKNVFVAPCMGDEGTAVGAALKVCKIENEDFEIYPGASPTKFVFAGNTIKGKVFEYVNSQNLKNYNVIELTDNIEEEVAKRLANNKIVCIVKDRMEFGPRALCHRTIMYNCDTKETNDWLNKKLSRTEFMPFAPVCMEEVADDLFKDLDGGRDSAKLMTMTFDCKDEFVENYPAACHIDNTARPQIVSKYDDAFTWNILFNYYKMTGKKALINTSFNLHNWPIIATKEVALESWLKSDTDCILIENVMIEKVDLSSL